MLGTLKGQGNIAPLPHATALEKEHNSDYKSKYNMSILEWREATRAQALSAYRAAPEYNYIQDYIKYLENEPWDKRRPQWRSGYRNNKMGLARRDRLAKMSDARPTIDVSSTIDGYKDASAAIEGCIRAEWNRQNMSQTLAMVYDLAMLHGTAFCKIGASKNKIKLTALGPDQVIPIQPSLESIQESSAILHRGWKPISYFHRIFPQSSQNVIQGARNLSSIGRGQFNRPESMDQTTWDNMSTGMKMVFGRQGMGGYTNAGDKYYGIAELEEYYVEDYSRNESSKTILMKDPFLPLDAHNWHYYVKPGERLYPRKRLIIFGGGSLVYDGPSPYWHGMYPFAAMWTNKVPWSFYGLSLYRDLLPMQRFINEIPAGISDMIAKVLNPPMLTKQGTVSPATFQAFNSDLPGARLILNGNVGDLKQAFVWQDPPQIPAYVQQMLQGVVNPDFDKLAGNIDVMSIQGKNQLPSGDSLDQMRDSLQTSLRREEKFVEAFLNDAGQQAVSNVIQFYDMKKRMQLLGEDGITNQDFFFDPGVLYPGKKDFGPYFWQMFGFQVKPGSLHSGANDRDKIEAVGLASRGLISRKELYRKLGMDPGDAERVIEELIEEQQFIAAMQGGAGGTRTPRPPEAKNEGVGV